MYREMVYVPYAGGGEVTGVTAPGRWVHKVGEGHKTARE